MSATRGPRRGAALPHDVEARRRAAAVPPRRRRPPGGPAASWAARRPGSELRSARPESYSGRQPMGGINDGVGFRDRPRVPGEARLGRRVRARGGRAARPALPRPAVHTRSTTPGAAIIDPLKEEVREQGLWATHLGPELGGQGYGQLKLALLNEILGRSQWAPIVFGCQAPDTGNAEIIAHYGTRRAEGAATCSRCSTASASPATR